MDKLLDTFLNAPKGLLAFIAMLAIMSLLALAVA